MENPSRHTAVHALVDRLATGCERSLSAARAMPPGVYTSAEFLALEEQAIFAKEWQCVGRASALGKPSNHLTATIAHQPVVVVRDRATVGPHSRLEEMECPPRLSGVQLSLDNQGNIASHWQRSSGQQPSDRSPVQDHGFARDLSNASRHTDARFTSGISYCGREASTRCISASAASSRPSSLPIPRPTCTWRRSRHCSMKRTRRIAAAWKPCFAACMLRLRSPVI